MKPSRTGRATAPRKARKAYKYLYRTDLNLQDQARVDRLQRVREVLGGTGVAAVCFAIDELARKLGVYDPPASAG